MRRQRKISSRDESRTYLATVVHDGQVDALDDGQGLDLSLPKGLERLGELDEEVHDGRGCDDD